MKSSFIKGQCPPGNRLITEFTPRRVREFACPPEKQKKHEARAYINQLIAEGNLIPDKRKNTTFKEFTKDFYI